MEDVRDVFHDAVIIYLEKCRDREFVVRITPEAYIVGIGKHLWSKKFKHDQWRVSFSEAALSLPDAYYPSVNEKRLLAVLERSGTRCLEILATFYYENMSMKSLAAALGYRSEHSAAVQKFKCLAKMRDFIRSKSMSYEDFVD